VQLARAGVDADEGLNVTLAEIELERQVTNDRVGGTSQTLRTRRRSARCSSSAEADVHPPGAKRCAECGHDRDTGVGADIARVRRQLRYGATLTTHLRLELDVAASDGSANIAVIVRSA
jgi:hypothetical protein